MKILVACEESQVVCIAFREKGHEAYSCDILDCSGGHPEWHIKDDVLKHLNDGWNLVIAHPPCTYLANSGVRWLYKPGLGFEGERYLNMCRAAWFFRKFVKYAITGKRIVIENPIPHKYAKLPPYHQIIQPWMFGHGETKQTCLWLYGLPNLIPTNIVEGREQKIWRMPPSPERAKLRSKTFPGIANAMADQWSVLL
jgi:hypothetical protein